MPYFSGNFPVVLFSAFVFAKMCFFQILDFQVFYFSCVFQKNAIILLFGPVTGEIGFKFSNFFKQNFSLALLGKCI